MLSLSSLQALEAAILLSFPQRQSNVFVGIMLAVLQHAIKRVISWYRGESCCVVHQLPSQTGTRTTPDKLAVERNDGDNEWFHAEVVCYFLECWPHDIACELRFVAFLMVVFKLNAMAHVVRY